MADSIASKFELINSKEVQALINDKGSRFEDVRESNSWSPYSSELSVNSKQALWLKFDLKNNSKDTIRNYIYSDTPSNTIYQVFKNDVKVFKNGRLIPLPQRTNKSNYYFTEIALDPFQTSQVFIKLHNPLNKKIDPPTLNSTLSYWETLHNINAKQDASISFIYIYIITITTIFVFALVFWLRLWKKLYLYYLGYLLFQIIYGFQVLRTTSASFGNLFTYIPTLSTSAFQPVQFVFIGFYILFIKHLLKVKYYDKLLAKVLSYLGRFCFVYAFSHFIFSYFFFGNMFAETVFVIVRLIIIPLNFILIFWIIYKVKHPLISYFIVGQTFFFIGAVLSSYVAYAELNFIPGHFFNFTQAPNIIFQIGLLAEVICFSLALGENVLLLQKEKTRANKELIVQLKENQALQENMNRKLDEKVHKKTEELIKVYSEIEKDREQKIKDEFTQKIRETEMIALRSQMNPHFIFNSLSAIKYLIMTSRNDDAITYLDEFSVLLRGILNSSKHQQITVEEELEILELYLSLERSRMGSSFSYDIEVASKEELSQYQIPPLLLQPLVENAIWHGLQPSLKAEKKLSIIFDTSDDLIITILDNGIGRKESAKKKRLHEAMGTSLVQDRLTLFNHLSNKSIRLKITDLEKDEVVLGTKITLTYET